MPSTPADLINRFYDVVWNKADEAEARRILDENFRFRGSLGPELRGPGGFVAYLRAVHAQLGNFTCTVEELVAGQDRVAARMRFSGIHKEKFFGIAPTGRQIIWSGAAFFRIGGEKITELWVLGDIEAVRRQIMPDRAAETFQV